MKKAFTLIEILVVITFLGLLLSLTIPQGVKLLNQFEKLLENSDKLRENSHLKAKAFLEASSKNIIVDEENKTISPKGIIL